MSARTSVEYSRTAILYEILDGRHKVIDANAGTGKTFTIEQIVIELVRSGAAQLDQILIVTFTEKATAELRSRIRTTIEAALASQNPSEVAVRLNDALASFHRAPIHTIHSFCRRMLSELAFDSAVRF